MLRPSPKKKQFPAGIVSFNCQRICAVYNFLKFHRGSLFSAPPSGGFCPISHLLNMLNYDIFQAELHSPQTKRQNVNKTQKTQIYKEREREREFLGERERDTRFCCFIDFLKGTQNAIRNSSSSNNNKGEQREQQKQEAEEEVAALKKFGTIILVEFIWDYIMVFFGSLFLSDVTQMLVLLFVLDCRPLGSF